VSYREVLACSEQAELFQLNLRYDITIPQVRSHGEKVAVLRPIHRRLLASEADQDGSRSRSGEY
jgi:hypothetical protein